MANYIPPRRFSSDWSKALEGDGVAKLRISGGEPTLGKEHLLALLELVEGTDYLFIQETNGVLIGSNADYAHQLARYTKIHVRVSLKAGRAEGFEERTGAKGDFWELPYEAISRLGKAKVSFHVAAMSDPRLMSSSERADMLRRLKEAGYKGYLEEEDCDPYRTSIVRPREAEVELF